jgi:Holliday junction resolvase RusA-like endonuclease
MGKVAGKGRPRFTVVGGHARAYTPAKTASCEALVREAGQRAMVQAPPLEGALHMSLTVYVTRPVSWSKRQVAEKPIPTGKPDLDNIVKLIGDALNGVCYWDDSQIASLQVHRQFSEDGERCEVTIREIVADAAISGSSAHLLSAVGGAA